MGRARATAPAGARRDGDARSRSGPGRQQGAVAVASRSHRDAETDAWLAERASPRRVSAGSSLKFCLVAEGRADVYPRFGPTMEWDTAAGHAVLRAAGGRVTTTDGAPFPIASPAFATRASSPAVPERARLAPWPRDAPGLPPPPACLTCCRRRAAHRAALRLLPWLPARPARTCRACAFGWPGSTCRIRSAWRPASTRTARPSARAAAARLRLRRDRHRHAAAAGRQSAPAPVPPRRGPRRHQPHGLQQRRRSRPWPPARRRATAGAASSASISAINKDSADPRRRLRSRAARRFARLPTTSPSTSPRPTRRACATCRARRARAAAGRPWRRAQRRRPAAAVPQDRARPRARGRGRTSPPSCLRASASTAHRRQHHARPAVGAARAAAREAGGLSGRPLLAPLDEAAGAAWPCASSGRLPLIGVGGIASGADAYAKIRAGATAVQLYTALVYRRPGAGRPDPARARPAACAGRLAAWPTRSAATPTWPLAR